MSDSTIFTFDELSTDFVAGIKLLMSLFGMISQLMLVSSC